MFSILLDYGGAHTQKGIQWVESVKNWQKVRNDCADRKVSLIGHSTDSAGFSLFASIQLITPTATTLEKGIYYSGLGIPDERFVTPYFWRLPSIAYGAYDHARKTFIREVKYDTRDLTFLTDTLGALWQLLITYMSLCPNVKKMDSGPFSTNDLLSISFFDQQPDTTKRIFMLKVAEMLHEHVQGSEGTSLYLTAVHNLTEPFF